MEATKTEASRVTVDEAKARLDRGEPLVFLDVRNDQAWGDSSVKIPGALRVPAAQAAAMKTSIPRDRGIITYCT